MSPLRLGWAFLAALMLSETASSAPTQGATRPDLHGDPLPAGAVARVGTMRLRMRGHLYSVAWSADGRWIATGNAPNLTSSQIAVWEAATGRRVHLLAGHAHVVRSVAFSPDCKRLVSTGGDGGVCVWDLSTRREVWRKTRGSFDSGVFTPDGKAVVLVDGKHIGVLDVADGRELASLRGHEAGVRAVAISADGKRLASCSDDGTVRLWDLRERKSQRLITLTEDRGLSVAFSSDGRTLVCGTFCGTVLVWDTSSGKETARMQAHRRATRDVVFSPDGSRIYTAGDAIYVWDAARGRELRQIDWGGAQIQRIALSPDGKTLAAVGLHGVLGLWNTTTGAALDSVDAHPGPIVSLSFSPDGKSLAIAGGGQAKLWDSATGKDRGIAFRGASRPHGVAFMPDGRSLAIAAEHSSAALYDVATGKLVRDISFDVQLTGPVALTGDGKVLAVSAADFRVRFFDTATGKRKLSEVEVSQNWASSTLVLTGPAFVLSPDGTSVAPAQGGDEQDTVIYDAATGKKRLCIKGTGRPAAFSPDGRLIAVRSNRLVRVYDVHTGALFRALEGHTGPVRAVAFSHDGKALVSGDQDGTVCVWEVGSGRERICFKGHEGPVLSVAFARDGRHIASGSDDLTALVWDLAWASNSSTDLAGLWRDLVAEDTASAHKALWSLAASKHAVNDVARRVRVVRPAPEGRVMKLLAELDSEEFAGREKAEAELRGLADAAVPGLRKALADGTASPEARRRVESLLARLETWPTTLRAVELLEHVGTPEARKVLEEWSTGLPEARLTREACAALSRLAAR